MQMAHTNDEIREQILQALYRIHNKARSRTAQLVGIRNLSTEVKTAVPRLKENEIAANVGFLVQNEFVEEVAIANSFAQAKFGNSKPNFKYRLAKDGLAYFEHGSKFDKSNTFAGIGDITGNGNNIIIGNHGTVTNISNSLYSEGHKLAEDLRRRVNALGELTDEEKISIQGDIETIKSQLAKQNPDKDILKKVKDNLGVLANIKALVPTMTQLFAWFKDNFDF